MIERKIMEALIDILSIVVGFLFLYTSHVIDKIDGLVGHKYSMCLY